MKNKTNFGGFGALPNNYPEVRASAISAICSFFEKDTVTFKETVDYLCLMYTLNKNEDKFYFMSDENFNLIKDFPLDNERRYVFETKKARPLLYSFSLSVIALICAYLFFNDKKYLHFANKYVNKILDNDFHNDYCRKSIIATSILYYISGKDKYLNEMTNIYNYMQDVIEDGNSYVHNNQLLTIDRLSEYAIGIEFYLNSKCKKLPPVLENYLNKWY